MNASAYVLASHIGASIKGRNFAPGSDPMAGGCSPGPQAYAPQEEAASVKPRAARTAFGCARRAQQVRQGQQLLLPSLPSIYCTCLPQQ
jgi:hypothetical protein